MKKSLLVLLSVLLLGCSANANIPEVEENIAATKDTAAQPAESAEPGEPAETKPPEEEVAVEETPQSGTEPTINRPVITLKHDKVMIDEGYIIPHPSYNIASIIDAEDGELPESDVWYGGLTAGPVAEAYFRTIHEPYDHCEFVSPGRKMIIPGSVEKTTVDGYNAMLERILAYDSDGYVSWADYYILEIPDTGETAAGSCVVNVEGLRIRTSPSTSSKQVAYAWPEASYATYETSEAEGYTWYRIGKELWVADNGEWLTIE